MKKLVLFDMDGTIYLGNKLFDFVPSLFDYLNNKKIDYVFLTNNSSVSIDYYVRKITSFGIKCDEHNFYTSSETTVKYLKDKGYKNLFVLGVKSFKKILKKNFNIIDEYNKDKKVDVVVASFDTELTYEDLKTAALYIQDGSDFIATNIDYRCPIEDGKYIPDCGGLCKWLEMCTNVPAKFMGKPNPAMIYQVAEKFNVDLKDIIIVGDRYYTDIMAGINAGIDTMGVLTGESTKEEFLSAKNPPTYIAETAEDLLKIL